MKLSKALIVAVITVSAAAPWRAAAQELPEVAHAPSVAQQPSLEAAKGLYAAASYEEALDMLTRLGDAPEHAAYQVFCLIALDRGADAEKRIQQILETDPLFAPDAGEASPRVQEMFDRVRTAIAPQLARAVYADAKAAFDRKEHAAALKKFDLLLQIIDRAGAAENTLLGELELLASGYVDLAKAGAAAAPPAAPAAASAAPSPATGAPVPPIVTPPVPIAETFPPWDRSALIGRGLNFGGVIRVRISAAGDVESAEIVDPIHPSYDQRLLDAASKWRYEPARRQGVPIGSERMVAVRLKEQ